MRCPHCDLEHPPQVKFCPKTGKEITNRAPIPFPIAEQSPHPCPHCSSEHPPHFKFCPKTGQPIQDLASAPVPVPDPVLTTTAVVGAAATASASSAADAVDAASAAAVANAATATATTRAPHGLLMYGLFYSGVCLMLAGLAMIGMALFSPQLLPQPVTSLVEQIAPGLLNPPAALQTPRGAPAASQPQAQVLASTFTPQPIATRTPTHTPTPTPTNTPTATGTPTPAFVTSINPKDNAPLVFVAGGEFLMGSDPSHDPYFWGAESPERNVNVDAFWIYQHEVTNGMYMACVAERACPRVQQTYSRTRHTYYGDPRFDDFPVIYVNHLSAQAYCVWAGGRLPREAEWEKAARGKDGRLFPWGWEPATSEQANFCDRGCEGLISDSSMNDGFPDTAPVGSFPAGISPYGAYDMAGNVWEWVQDYFQPTYPRGDLDNPVGPASSRHRVIRGGSWSNPSAGVRIVQRDGVRPDLSLDTLGFRCVVEEGS